MRPVIGSSESPRNLRRRLGRLAGLPLRPDTVRSLLEPHLSSAARAEPPESGPTSRPASIPQTQTSGWAACSPWSPGEDPS